MTATKPSSTRGSSKASVVTRLACLVALSFMPSLSMLPDAWGSAPEPRLDSGAKPRSATRPKARRGKVRSSQLVPAWRDSYRVRIGGASRLSNDSFLDNLDAVSQIEGDVFANLMDARHVLEWRQRYETLNRQHELKQHAGLNTPELERAHTGEINRFGDDVRNEIEKRHLSIAERRARAIIDRDKNLKAVVTTVLAPAAVVAGVYVGTPLRLRLTDDTQFRVRSNIRDKYGSLELNSPFGLGTFEYRPTAPESRHMLSSPVVNFGEALNMGRAVDYSQERFQLTFTRNLPWLDVTSRLLYGASSNTIVGSISKQLTGNLSCVVDSIHWLSPVEATRSIEQSLRLRYDIRF